MDIRSVSSLQPSENCFRFLQLNPTITTLLASCLTLMSYTETNPTDPTEMASISESKGFEQTSSTAHLDSSRVTNFPLYSTYVHTKHSTRTGLELTLIFTPSWLCDIVHNGAHKYEVGSLTFIRPTASCACSIRTALLGDWGDIICDEPRYWKRKRQRKTRKREFVF